jgi:NADPH:quinone reductase-like Zn-dependent oxidoreductase
VCLGILHPSSPPLGAACRRRAAQNLPDLGFGQLAKEDLKMKAIQYRAYGDYAENRLADIPPPLPVDGQVLVQMRTVGVNTLDNTFRSGRFYAATPENLPRVGGQMGAGVVVESKSPRFKAGDRVFVTGPGFGIIADGVWRDLVAAPAAGLWPVPDSIDDDHAAAFLAGAGYLTGFLVLSEFVSFRPGQSVLAPGIGGAVGMESVQIARTLGTSLAISTASATAKAETARAFGYQHIIDLSKESVRSGVMRMTRGKGVDVVIDGVGGPLTGEALGCLSFGGLYAVVGCAGGRETSINLTDVIWKAAKVRGFMMRDFAPETIGGALRTLTEHAAQAALQPTIAKIFPLADAAEAVPLPDRRPSFRAGPHARQRLKKKARPGIVLGGPAFPCDSAPAISRGRAP